MFFFIFGGQERGYCSRKFMAPRFLFIRKPRTWGRALRGEPQREPQEVGGVGMCLTLGLVCDVSFISAWGEGHPELGTQGRR